MGEVLITRGGNLLRLAPDLSSATVLDVEDLSTRTTALNVPDFLSDRALGTPIAVWDGCRYYVWGQHNLEYGGGAGCDNPPPNVGCNPAPPEIVSFELVGGAVFGR